MRLYLCLAAVILMLSGGLYVMYLRNTVETLENENEKLQTEIENTQKILSSLKADYSSIPSLTSDSESSLCSRNYRN